MNTNRGRTGTFPYIFAGEGFVVAIQDTRGRFESEGEFVIQGRDQEDGYDAVEWLAAQPWSNGKVGTYGCSYGGDTQIMRARARPPHLAAQIPQAAGSSVGPIAGQSHNFGTFSGGAFELAAAAGWFWDWGMKYFYRPPPHMSRERWLAAAQYYVAQNNTTHKCSIVSHKPDGTKLILLGSGGFKTKSQARDALKGMSECRA